MKKIVLLAIAFGIFVSCTDDDDEVRPPLSVTPESLMGYVGQRFTAIEPSLKNKLAYMYSPATTGSDARMVVEAVDTAAVGRRYEMEMLLGSDGIVDKVILGGYDSLGQAEGNRNFLYWYEHAALNAPAISSQQQWTALPHDANNVVTMDSLVNALRVGKAPQPSLNWQTGHGVMKLDYTPGNGRTVVSVDWPY